MMSLSWKWFWHTPWKRQLKCGCPPSRARLSGSWQLMRWRTLRGLRKHRHYRYLIPWRAATRSQLCRIRQEDSMGSVDSSTQADPDSHWPRHCTRSFNEDDMHSVERFATLPYDRTSTATDVEKAIPKLFAKRTTSSWSYKCSFETARPMRNIPMPTCLGPGSSSCTKLSKGAQ